MLASRGLAANFAERFGSLPIESSTRATRAIRTFEPQYSGQAAPGQLVRPLLHELGADAFAVVPFHAGATVGSIVVAGLREQVPTTAEAALPQMLETVVRLAYPVLRERCR